MARESTVKEGSGLQNEMVCLWEGKTCQVKKQILSADRFALVWCLVLLKVLPATIDGHTYPCIHCILMCLFPITPLLSSLRTGAMELFVLIHIECVIEILEGG